MNIASKTKLSKRTSGKAFPDGFWVDEAPQVKEYGKSVMSRCERNLYVSVAIEVRKHISGNLIVSYDDWWFKL